MKNTLRTKMAAVALPLTMTVSMVIPLLVRAQSLDESYEVTVAGVPLVIQAGSMVEDLKMTDDSITFTVPEGEVADLQTDRNHHALENDLSKPACNLIDRDINQLFVVGPTTVTVRPSTYSCPNGDDDIKDSYWYTFSYPTEGSVLKSGSDALLLWGHDGPQPASVRLRLSVDGGKTYSKPISADLIDNGFYTWQVPDMPSASHALLKIEIVNNGFVAAIALSDEFAIEGTSPEPVIEEEPSNGGLVVEPYDYNVDEETNSAETIGVNMSIVANPVAQVCVPDSRIKAKGSAAVYYCAADGKRYVFPNFATYSTWYGNDFNGVIELDIADVARIPLGGNVTYRPGVRMLKLQSATEVFAVAADSTLRYVTEKVAIRLYGPNWNKIIDDLPDTFFTDYRVGEPVKE